MAKKLKRWYESKTIILNGLAGLFGALPEILNLFDVHVLTALGVSNPTKYYALIGVLTTMLNIILRTQSDTPTPPIKTKARTQKLD